MSALNEREVATVLAALRLRQSDLQAVSGKRVPANAGDFDNIATDEESFDSLDIEEIDALCERLNTDRPELGGDCSHLHLYQRTHAGFVRIAAILAGEQSANDYMREHPGTALLSLVGENVALLADEKDYGVPEAKVQAPSALAKAAEYFGLFLTELRLASSGFDMNLSDAATAELIEAALEHIDPADDDDAAADTSVGISGALYVMRHVDKLLATDNGGNPA